MTVFSGFFNSNNTHDRWYNADHFSRFFDGLITDGVYYNFPESEPDQTNKAFYVKPLSSGIGVSVAQGRGWFKGTWIWNSASLLIDTNSQAGEGHYFIPLTTTVSHRIDAIVIDVDISDEGRWDDILVVTGSEGPIGSTVYRPTLIDQPSHKQYAIAYVEIIGGATSISQENIKYVVAEPKLDEIGNVERPVTQDGETPAVEALLLYSNLSKAEMKEYIDTQDAIIQAQVDAIKAPVFNIGNELPANYTSANAATYNLKGDGTENINAMWGKIKRVMKYILEYLPVKLGGTGKTSHTANSVLVGDGQNAVKNIAPSKDSSDIYAGGAFFRPAGTSSNKNPAPQFGTLPIAQGGTGSSSAAGGYKNLGDGISGTDDSTNFATGDTFIITKIVSNANTYVRRSWSALVTNIKRELGIDSTNTGSAIKFLNQKGEWKAPFTFATGSTNGTIKVTNAAGTASEVAVKGLGSAAYTASSAYATSGHTHTLSLATDSGNSAISLAANTKYKLTSGGKTLIFTTPKDTTYTSKDAVSGGSDLSLVTTGEKATWNAKSGSDVNVTQNAALTTSATSADYRVLLSLGATDSEQTGKVNKAAGLKFNPNTGNLTVSKINNSTPVLTDQKVAQTATTTNSNYEVLFSATADNTTRTEGTRKNSNLTFNPNTGRLNATTFNGVKLVTWTENNVTKFGYTDGNTNKSFRQPTGNAGVGQVVKGYTFANASSDALTGTFEGEETIIQVSTASATFSPASGKYFSKVTVKPTPTQEKTVTASRSAQTVTPDSGKHLSKVTVNKYPDASGNYTCGSNNGAASSNDMGATNNYRYVDATAVYAKGVSDTQAGTWTEVYSISQNAQVEIPLYNAIKIYPEYRQQGIFSFWFRDSAGRPISEWAPATANMWYNVPVGAVSMLVNTASAYIQITIQRQYKQLHS